MCSKYSAFRISVFLNALLLFSLMVFTTRPNNLPARQLYSVPAPNRTKPTLIEFKDSEAFNASNFNSYSSSDSDVHSVYTDFYCDNTGSQSHFAQRGQYWVLYNYVKAEKRFGCYESITYSTHSDFTFLDNLEPLLERWMGPVSIALYSPGSDLTESIRRIIYLRECSQSLLVKSYVTFHLFFESGQLPSSQIPQDPSSSFPVDCNSPPDFGDNLQTYRKSKNLTYPVNVARNVAREMSTTFYVLASDIELYPSPNLIFQFLTMIESDNSEILHRSKNPKVFVLPIFEVEKNITKLPQNKSELQFLLKNGSAVPFHKFVCEHCHKIPKQIEWNEAKEEPNLGIFHVGKRQGTFKWWEPIYIGTKFDPNYDERLSWEGQKDKMTQGYILCVLEYEFHIFNNAFLIHRPGIKRTKHLTTQQLPWIEKTKAMIQKTILPELKIMYGSHRRCAL